MIILDVHLKFGYNKPNHIQSYKIISKKNEKDDQIIKLQIQVININLLFVKYPLYQKQS